MIEARAVYPLKRFVLKLAFLSAFALMQGRSGILKSVILSFMISGNISIWLAIFSKVWPFREPRFTYWDEAAAFFAMSAFAALLADSW